MSIKLAPGETRQIDVTLTPLGEWILPTGHIDPDHGWSGEEYGYDGSLGSGTYTVYKDDDGWTRFLEFTHEAFQCRGCRIYLTASPQSAGCIADIDVCVDGTYADVFDGKVSGRAVWNEVFFEPRTITKARVRFKSTAYQFTIHEFEFYGEGG